MLEAGRKLTKRSKKLSLRLAAFLIGLLLSLLLAEVILRIYNPIEIRLRGSQLILPRDRQYVFTNQRVSKLDPTVVHTKNSLGFRGPEPPPPSESTITMVAVGGSTTECLYLSDGQSWPERVHDLLTSFGKNCWINNAGLDGHSTFGHLVLLDKVISTLKPDYVLFLVGVNDVGREDLPIYDKRLLIKPTWTNALTAYSELWATLMTLRRNVMSIQAGVRHTQINLADMPKLTLTPEQCQQTVESHRAKCVSLYETRLTQLVNKSRAYGITPVLITQPALYGDGIDPTSQINLANLEVFSGSNGPMNGSLAWRVLELYNDVTRKVARSHQIFLIDLAFELPKDQRYFYDWLHFTPSGCEQIAQIVARHLNDHL